MPVPKKADVTADWRIESGVVTFPAMSYAITPPVIPSLPIVGSDQRFPLRRIFCIGRNYAEHAR